MDPLLPSPHSHRPPPPNLLLSLRVLQQLVQHLCLLNICACAGGSAHRELRDDWLWLQVHVPVHAGIVSMREGRRRGHVTHVLWGHGPDHVGV